MNIRFSKPELCCPYQSSSMHIFFFHFVVILAICICRILIHRNLGTFSWCADHCNQNKHFYCFSQSKNFACVKECGKNLKNNSEDNSVRNLIRGIFPQNLFCFHRNFGLRNVTELGGDSNYK